MRDNDFIAGSIILKYILYISISSSEVFRVSTAELSKICAPQCGTKYKNDSRAREDVDQCLRENGESEAKGYFRIMTHYFIG